MGKEAQVAYLNIGGVLCRGHLQLPQFSNARALVPWRLGLCAIFLLKNQVKVGNSTSLQLPETLKLFLKLFSLLIWILSLVCHRLILIPGVFVNFDNIY